jgi:hypothetical protein
MMACLLQKVMFTVGGNPSTFALTNLQNSDGGSYYNLPSHGDEQISKVPLASKSCLAYNMCHHSQTMECDKNHT